MWKLSTAGWVVANSAISGLQVPVLHGKSPITSRGNEERAMRILVTGGAGFIGSHMVDRLVSEGHEVVVLDNLATGLRENVPAAAQLLTGDVSQLDDVERAFAGGLDAVFHIAGQVSLIRSYADPTIDLLTNVQGTVNVLMTCVKCRVPRFVYASSMTVYSGDAPLPTPEDPHVNQRRITEITKWAGQESATCTPPRRGAIWTSRSNVTAFRMYNVYGPRQTLEQSVPGSARHLPW